MRCMVNQREILKTAVEQGHLGLAELDAECHFVAANPAFLSMLGMRESELLGESWHVSVHPEDRSRVEAAYSLARTAGRGYVEIRAVRTDQVVVY
jgi:PAS domain S-box-containing protein